MLEPSLTVLRPDGDVNSPIKYTILVGNASSYQVSAEIRNKIISISPNYSSYEAAVFAANSHYRTDIWPVNL